MVHRQPEKPDGGHVFCHWCWTPFIPKAITGRPRRFCGERCKTAHFNQARTRGAQAYPLLLEWRRTRGKRKGLLGDLANLVDLWIEQDKRR